MNLKKKNLSIKCKRWGIMKGEGYFLLKKRMRNNVVGYFIFIIFLKKGDEHNDSLWVGIDIITGIYTRVWRIYYLPLGFIL